jgi:hypothetical protein
MCTSKLKLQKIASTLYRWAQNFDPILGPVRQVLKASPVRWTAFWLMQIRLEGHLEQDVGVSRRSPLGRHGIAAELQPQKERGINKALSVGCCHTNRSACFVVHPWRVRNKLILKQKSNNPPFCGHNLMLNGDCRRCKNRRFWCTQPVIKLWYLEELLSCLNTSK